MNIFKYAYYSTMFLLFPNKLYDGVAAAKELFFEWNHHPLDYVLTKDPKFSKFFDNQLLLEHIKKPFDFEQLGSLPDNTFGYQYAKYIKSKSFVETLPFEEGFFDRPVRKFIYQYYKYHDIQHFLLDLDTTIEGELILARYYWYNTRTVFKKLKWIANFFVDALLYTYSIRLVLTNLNNIQAIKSFYNQINNIKNIAINSPDFNYLFISRYFEEDLVTVKKQIKNSQNNF